LDDLSEVHSELEHEQAYLDRLYARLDQLREQTRARLEVALMAEVSEIPNALAERDALVRHLEERLAGLSGVEARLCFGRLDLRSGERFYIGRIGLADARNEPLLLDWRAPAAAAFYQATAAAPGDVVHRRHLTTHGRRVVAIEDEVLDLGAMGREARRHLVGEGALMAAVQAARTGRMGDIVNTIQVEQDRVIRSELRGVLVVQGGPGTGKTAVALHRTAYLLYTHRDRLAQSGVLLVGPSPVFLRYIERVLPSLGESGVVMSTPGTLFPGVTATLEDSPAAARLKGDVGMVEVLTRAVRASQRVPKVPVELVIDGTPITILPDAFADARKRARATRRPHNEARAVFVRRLLDHMAVVLARQTWPNARPDQVDRELIMESLLESDDLWLAVNRAWGLLTAQQLLAELYTDARLLAKATSDLSEAEREHLRRAPEAAEHWTISDVPLLDEAAEILGEDKTAERLAARAAAFRRREEIAFAREALQYTGGAAAALVSAETLADRFADTGPQLSIAERAARDRRWAFGHIVVDEAQELSAMAWRLLLRRCSSRSMTLVGDVTQVGSAAGASSWAEALAPHVGDRWRSEELTINYRTPAAVMDVAAAMLAAAGITAPTPESVRVGETPRARRVGEGDLAALVGIVQDQLTSLGDGRMAVIAPATGPWAAGELAHALIQALPAGTVGQGDSAIDAAVAVLEPRQSKGLEVDIVVVVEPAAIVAASPRGANDLYVALTRPTQRLVVVHAGELPPGMVLEDQP
jgi:DNA helicase IV